MNTQEKFQIKTRDINKSHLIILCIILCVCLTAGGLIFSPLDTALASSHTIIVLESNGGDANGSTEANYQSSELDTITHVVRDGYILNGYFTSATNGDLLITADGALVAKVDGYTDAAGLWISNKSVATLYAQWTHICHEVTCDYGGMKPNEVIEVGQTDHFVYYDTGRNYTNGYSLMGVYSTEEDRTNKTNVILPSPYDKGYIEYSDLTGNITLYYDYRPLSYSGDGSYAHPYLINTYEQLDALIRGLNDSVDRFYDVTESFTVDHEGILPIFNASGFEGHIDFNENSILCKGYYYTYFESTCCAGLFPLVNGNVTQQGDFCKIEDLNTVFLCAITADLRRRIYTAR